MVFLLLQKRNGNSTTVLLGVYVFPNNEKYMCCTILFFSKNNAQTTNTPGMIPCLLPEVLVIKKVALLYYREPQRQRQQGRHKLCLPWCFCGFRNDNKGFSIATKTTRKTVVLSSLVPLWCPKSKTYIFSV